MPFEFSSQKWHLHFCTLNLRKLDFGRFYEFENHKKRNLEKSWFWKKNHEFENWENKKKSWFWKPRIKKIANKKTRKWKINVNLKNEKLKKIVNLKKSRILKPKTWKNGKNREFENRGNEKKIHMIWKKSWIWKPRNRKKNKKWKTKKMGENREFEKNEDF